jgi:hypothetical protein
LKLYLGLDLGQQNDYTAICVVEDVKSIGGEKALHIRHLERFRHTLYPDVADRVDMLLATPQLKNRTDLIVDATGVGPAVTDIFAKRRRKFKAVKIHGGDAETHTGGVYRVPKRNLVSALQVLLQSGNLKIAERLDLAEVLRTELLNFRIKVNISTAHDSYEAWREGDHDDLVLAAALAAWGASRSARYPGAPEVVGEGGYFTLSPRP